MSFVLANLIAATWYDTVSLDLPPLLLKAGLSFIAPYCIFATPVGTP